MRKKIVSLLTLGFMMISSVNFTAFANEISTDDTSMENTNIIAENELANTVNYDTSIYNGDRGYLMEDTFSGGKNGVYGWDVDTRGGGVAGAEWSEFKIADSSDTELVSMTKHFMPHKSGKITFECCVRPYDVTNGFFYELTGENKRLFKFITNNGYLCLEGLDGKLKKLAPYKMGERLTLKAEIDIDNQLAKIGVNGKKIGTFDFAELCEQLDSLCISTSKEEEMIVALEYFYLYFNYIINDTFMYGKDGETPDDWQLDTDSMYPGIGYDKGMYYPDTWAYVLKDISSVDDVKLSRNFESLNDDFVYEASFLIRDKKDGIAITLGNDKNDVLKLETKKDNIILNGKDIAIENYRNNFWYKLQVKAKPSEGIADICINYKTVLQDVKFNPTEFSKIGFYTDVKGTNELRIDDIVLYKSVPRPEDYIARPEVVKAKDGISIGMQHYAMWNEGSHYGWDRVNAYSDRIPYMGHYNERSPEAADWIIKYEVEHGIDFAVYDWHRESTLGMGIDNPIKISTRNHALYQGYFNAEYSDCRDFAILYSAISSKSLGGYDDFVNNVAPYLVEYFFKDPRYKKIDNRPLLFMYQPQNFVNVMGGIDIANAAIDYLDDLCKQEGMNGLRMMWDGSGNITADVLNLRGGYAYAYAQVGATYNNEIINNNRVEKAFQNPVRSIAMGWNKNPWMIDSSSHYFLTSEEIGKLANQYVTEYTNWEENGIDRDKILMLTCWDEYGEGHFFSPTRVAGFETLNAIRNAVTDEGERTHEELPDSLSLARMSSLYEPNRRALMDHQLDFPDRPNVLENIAESELYTIAEFDFSDPASVDGWQVFQDADDVHWEDGALVFKSTARDVGVALYNLNIPAEEIAYARVTSDTPGGGTGMLFYQTTEDTNMGTGGKRFNIEQDGKGYETNLGAAYDISKLKGNITGLRWDPVDDVNPGRYFKVKKIEILGYKISEESQKLLDDYEALISVKDKYKVTYSGNATTRVVDPFIKDDMLYVSAYQLLKDIGCKVTWSWNNKTLTAEREDYKVVMKDGSDIITVNGVDKKLSGVCYYGGPSYYNYGNFFVPLRDVITALNGTVTWNDNSNTADIKFPIKADGFDYLAKRDSTKPLSFMFDTATDYEGWTYNTFIASASLKKGALKLSIAGNDPMIYSSKFSVPAGDYKYLRVRMKNETTVNKATMFFITSSDTAWGGKKKWNFNISSQDKEFKEYIIDLSTAPWEGTITQLRFDPVDNSAVVAQGNVYIDSIEFLADLD